MKVLVTDVEKEGLESLLGQRVTFLCANYIYTGKLIGVNTTCVKLEDPAIVYETGAWGNSTYKDEQKLGSKVFYLQVGAIEGFGVLK